MPPIPPPEPFRSFPSLAKIVLPNCCKGVPGVALARDARRAAFQDALNAPFFSPTPPFPYPYPTRCQSPVAALITPGSPAHTLASVYWAFGWCEGVLSQLKDADVGNPTNRAAHERFWAFHFPNRELETWDPCIGGFRPKAWDDIAVRTAAKHLYDTPRWSEWFAAYVRAGRNPPTCFWPTPTTKPSTTPAESP